MNVLERVRKLRRAAAIVEPVAADNDAAAAAVESPFRVAFVPQRRLKDGVSWVEWGNGVKISGYVVLTNLSEKPQHVSETWNSWGYQAVSFELTLPDGAVKKATLKSQRFTKNFASTFIIPPGEHQVFPIKLDGRWDGKAAFAGRGQTKVKLRAVYELSKTDDSKRIGVSTSRAESEQFEVTLSHW